MEIDFEILRTSELADGDTVVIKDSDGDLDESRFQGIAKKIRSFTGKKLLFISAASGSVTTPGDSTLVEQLKAAIKAGGPQPVVQGEPISVHSIDTGPWVEFGDFFKKPKATGLLHHYMDDAGLKVVLPCAFVSVTGKTKELAEKALRVDLKQLVRSDVDVKAFLCPPNFLEIRRPPVGDEPTDPGVTYTVDLSGPKPGVRTWAAFCFFFGTYTQPSGVVQALDVKVLKELGLSHAVYEGQVGQEVR